MSPSDRWYSTPRPLNPSQRSRFRFFARIRAAELACPRCGWIVRIGSGSRHGLSRSGYTERKTQAAHKSYTPAWDPRRSLFACPQCELKLVLGIAAWTLTPRSSTPTDALPTVQEARVLRWLSPLWRSALRGAALAVEGAAAILTKRGSVLRQGGRRDLAALGRVRAALRTRNSGSGVLWAAYGAVLTGTLCTARGAMPRGKMGPEANVVLDPGDVAQVGGEGLPIPEAPGGGLIRAEVAELLESGEEQEPDPDR